MSCDIGGGTERLENELCSTVYSSAHFPTFPFLPLRHSSSCNPSVALPTSQLILQPFRCFTCVIVHSPNPSFASHMSQALHLIHLKSRPKHFKGLRTVKIVLVQCTFSQQLFEGRPQSKFPTRPTAIKSFIAMKLLHVHDRAKTLHEACISETSQVLTVASLQRLKMEAIDQELDTKLRSVPARLSTVQLKFCAVCGNHQNYIVKSQFRTDIFCLIATCNRHEEVAQRLRKEVISTIDASKIRERSNWMVICQSGLNAKIKNFEVIIDSFCWQHILHCVKLDCNYL